MNLLLLMLLGKVKYVLASGAADVDCLQGCHGVVIWNTASTISITYIFRRIWEVQAPSLTSSWHGRVATFCCGGWISKSCSCHGSGEISWSPVMWDTMGCVSCGKNSQIRVLMMASILLKWRWWFPTTCVWGEEGREWSSPRKNDFFAKTVTVCSTLKYCLNSCFGDDAGCEDKEIFSCKPLSLCVLFCIWGRSGGDRWLPARCLRSI